MTEPRHQSEARMSRFIGEPLAGVAVLPPGLEEEGAAELKALGATSVQVLRRAVAFRTDLEGFYRLQLQARLPFRILRELARFSCDGPRQLYEAVAGAADWDQWLPPSRSFRVDVSGSLPGLAHSHFTALQVKNALVDGQRQRWGERSSIDLNDPELCLHLHLGQAPGGRGGVGVLSVDGAGGSLHRRGWRAAVGLAPLKENLASGLIALTGWDGSVPLADPLCGSGTLLIEAACRQLGRVPGLDPLGGVPRPQLLRHWPDFQGTLWEREVRSAQALSAAPPALAPIMGLERDADVLVQARANSVSAGVAEHVQLQQGDCRDFQPPNGPGVIVCNPPYGARLGGGEDLEGLYADLGAMLKQRCSGWSLWLLSGNPELTGALRMKARRRIPVSNGGIDCRWLNYEIR
ncbi:class I SAM-dependent RNA methyltransferase [Synechococcus sp. WH 5701]|uniref:THUMP domain-containing class I SAM-dependent RNA methyltransferase n=2 Tax=unclassified Synechococcus TaxID=2626047 RepID=UPI000069930E|nr:Putative RNA methylase family protein [Synechococcus sp. WH 5701]